MMVYYNSNTFQSTGNIFDMKTFDTTKFDNVTQLEIIFKPSKSSKFLDITIISNTNHEKTYDVSLLNPRSGEKLLLGCLVFALLGHQ